MAAQTLTLAQGIDSGYAWPIVGADNQPADLTGWAAACQIRQHEAPTSPLLTTLAAAVVGSAVVVSWTAEQSLAWEWNFGAMDVLLTNPDGRPVQIVWQGQVHVDQVVTHA